MSWMGLLALAGCDALREEAGIDARQWRFAIEETAGSVQHEYALRFKDLIEEKSGGAIEVSIYTYGTLGTSDQVTELLAMGPIQFAFASPGHLGTLIPEVQAFLLHFLFDDDPLVNNRALRDPRLLAAFDPLYAEKGLKLLSVIDEGWMVWTTDRPIRRPEDFSGVRVRVMTSPLLLAAYSAYGSSPTPLPYGEVYGALQLNMIDAQVNPVFAIQEMGFYEVSDYMIFAHHLPFIATAAANREFFDGLDGETRAMVLETIEQLHDYIFDLQIDYNLRRLEMILNRKPGMNVIERLSEEERDLFREASLPVRERFLRMTGERGRVALGEIQNALDRARESL